MLQIILSRKKRSPWGAERVKPPIERANSIIMMEQVHYSTLIAVNWYIYYYGTVATQLKRHILYKMHQIGAQRSWRVGSSVQPPRAQSSFYSNQQTPIHFYVNQKPKPHTRGPNRPNKRLWSTQTQTERVIASLQLHLFVPARKWLVTTSFFSTYY